MSIKYSGSNSLTKLITLIKSKFDSLPTIYATKTITDIGSHFTTDTVEGALQELGAAKTTVTIKRW